ncbi:MAG: Acetylxylan esterase [Luteibacter sp.]|uniref:alpha/beta hydrolase n=1 Tax=Luteibacter sp. TaxID=1886636 RepID=UPI0013839CE2|nr:alpha/beta hydrolase [Luteibacter sp.]KAF1004830.1 MAG: Acetylxylan esterase [Luteibacter sp.]
MFRSMSLLLSLGALALLASGPAAARRSHRDDAPSPSSATCFDPSDSRDIPLWTRNVPGSVGDDPCRDIPFVREYVPSEGARGDLPAILIIPGGGYDHLTDAKEQEPVAQHFADAYHVKAFVLYYRLVRDDGTYRYPVPMWDGRRALNLLGHDAARLGIDPRRIGLFGFSAGGHLASTLALHPESDFGMPSHDAVDTANVRPYFLGLGYPVISMLPSEFASPNSLKHLLNGYRGRELDRLEQELSSQDHVTAETPPVFLFESLDDQRISAQNSVLFANALQAAGVPADVHLFRHGEHGAGLAEGIPEEEAWPGMFGHWLNARGFIDEGRSERRR